MPAKMAVASSKIKRENEEAKNVFGYMGWPA